MRKRWKIGILGCWHAAKVADIRCACSDVVMLTVTTQQCDGRDVVMSECRNVGKHKMWKIGILWSREALKIATMYYTSL